MRTFLFKRILQMIPVIMLVSVLAFMISYLAPGDPMDSYRLGDMSEEKIEELRAELELDGTLVERYVGWLKNVCKGNLGYSIIKYQPVSKLILDKLGNTILLMGTSLLLSIVVSIPLGLCAGMNKNKLTDNIISLISYIGISTPAFWMGIVLTIVFSLKLGWLPNVGMRTTGVHTTIDLIRHLILPSVVLSLSNTATFTRYIRSNTIAQLEEDYILTARAKGLSTREILFGHVLKNCLLPIITLVGMNFGNLVTGSFIVESIFGWPGMGTLGIVAINSRDYPLIMGFTMLSCLLLVFGNFLSDILYGVVDPRIKQEVDHARNR